MFKKTEVQVQLDQQLRAENQKRKEAEKRLNQQLTMERALAECSRILMQKTTNKEDQIRLLNQALDILLNGVDASRSFVISFFTAEDTSDRMRIFAEACASGIPAQISNEANQNFPVAEFPQAIIESLKSGKPVQGQIEILFAGNQHLDAFLNQDPPIMSVAFFPIFIDNTLSGLVGFDDCLVPRDWGDSVIRFLGIASEMIGSTIQRWDISDQLVYTLKELEQRVERRTQTLNQSNEQLRSEIKMRQKFQNELQNRLKNEQILARASVKLADSGEFHQAVEHILEDLGEIMNAGSVSLVINPPDGPTYSPNRNFLKILQNSGSYQEICNLLIDTESWASSGRRSGDPLLIDNLAELPSEAKSLLFAAENSGVESFIIWPLIAGEMVLGLLLT